VGNDDTASGLCPVAGFDNMNVEPSGYFIRLNENDIRLKKEWAINVSNLSIKYERNMPK
jgi:hypothetical protein